MARFGDIDEYLAACTPAGRAAIEQIRTVAHRAVPDGVDTISYQIPGIRRDGRLLVSFGAWKHHVGMYPVPAGDDELLDALAPYRTETSTLRFPLDKPLPLDLIEMVVAALAR
ncbi:MAG TPA: DUF1801 domain-containing protein [Ilumatobacteraceae bacterium]|nr:DUF1801 domain-containing protein [Ilumatobacteraceae bacterium]HUC32718.1 DUF1801 domain-containing protein [Ilumatobacteraceae bacterium]